MRSGAWLIASGIIQEREPDAAGALAASGIITERRRQRGDWVTLQCRRV
jgi:ribosomal protein L11 methylase PrmA